MIPESRDSLPMSQSSKDPFASESMFRASLKAPSTTRRFPAIKFDYMSERLDWCRRQPALALHQADSLLEVLLVPVQDNKAVMAQRHAHRSECGLTTLVQYRECLGISQQHRLRLCATRSRKGHRHKRATICPARRAHRRQLTGKDQDVGRANANAVVRSLGDDSRAADGAGGVGYIEAYWPVKARRDRAGCG
ncbi:hypothetical protein DAEQUDRAFT_82814 [Daedalea quercina L-15889]|uniref:Uncharacterized protein n=1 Tax=Daedalea quercina L-15889 TaxID=1314783 RepID=A0A165SHS3_9APHY|nr:hypothetical protein DAEQUDRAFT_82814 [Daedalea quercina L-15889]